MTTTNSRPTGHVDLDISGMTCASCAARIEKRLNRVDGVTATVNFATERAAVDFDPDAVSTDDLVGGGGDGLRRRPARSRRRRVRWRGDARG